MFDHVHGFILEILEILLFLEIVSANMQLEACKSSCEYKKHDYIYFQHFAGSRYYFQFKFFSFFPFSFLYDFNMCLISYI